jgi:hypothetical protein
VSNTLSAATNTGGLNAVTHDYLPAVYDTNYSNAGRLDTSNSLTGTSNITLDAIKVLQTTAKDQLVLLTAALKPSVVSVSITGSGNTTPGSSPGVPSTLNNQVVDSLNKIVWNTYVIAQNTEYRADGTLAHTHAGGGTFAAGGLITGRGTGTSDSIHAMLSNREFVIKNAAVEKFGVGFFDQLNAGIMPPVLNDNRPVNVAAPIFRGGNNDNRSDAALLARLDKLTSEVERLQEIVASGSNGIMQTTYEAGEKGASASKESGRAIRDEIRHRRRDQRAANG